MAAVLIVGASRGLGAELVKKYADRDVKVLATTRSNSQRSTDKVTYIPNIDVSSPTCGPTLVAAIEPHGPVSTAIISAGYFGKESFDQPDWDAEVKMYTTSAIGPVFVVHHLVKAGLLRKASKVILVSSESGSITLRHESEGGGNFAHHASKSALRKLLSLDLKESGIAIGIVHPGFMYDKFLPIILFSFVLGAISKRQLQRRTEMTKGVGFDKFWDSGGAVTPDAAAQSLIEWVEGTFSIEMTGEYWAPRGPGDIGTAEAVLGHNLPTPLKLPW